MKKLLLVTYIVLFMMLFNIIICIIMNEVHVSNYNKGNNSDFLVKSLIVLDFAEPCVARYNYGNILYQKENYEKAAEQYFYALDESPSKKKECDIRVNLALSLLKQVNLNDIETEDGKNNVIEALEEIIDILCENDCAHKYDDDGHDTDAQTLKNEIEQFLNTLKEEENQQQNEEDEENEENEEEEEEPKDPREEELEELLKQGQEERQSELAYDEELYNYDYGDYYSGKRW